MTNVTNDDQTLSTFGINITGTNDSRTSEVAKNNVSIMEKKQDGGSDLFAVKTRQEMKMSLHFSPYVTTFSASGFKINSILQEPIILIRYSFCKNLCFQ